MDNRLVLFAFLTLFLLSPSLAEEYIIVPPPESGLEVHTEEILTEANATIIYGTEDCAAALTEEQAQNLEEKGFLVYPNLEVTAFLNESTSQINVTELWNISINGTNLTGTGQTICLVDSGIDANNSAFGDGWNGTILAGQAFFQEGESYINESCSSSNYTACYDDYGHGTKIAGILISQDPVYRGVAPDAKLVIVKVLNSSGQGEESDIVQGVNYCTNKSGEYNISVISLSIGSGDNSSNYCDNEPWMYPGMGDAINNAVAHDIIVVAAAGNKGSSTNLSTPACLYNSTPVGWVDRSDAIAANSNYWPLPIIFAPGTSIYTTLKGGIMGQSDTSGTSFSVPHVSGVFALMKQYMAAVGITRTPQELEDMAVATGVAVNENPNNTRVDAFSLYVALADPAVLITFPAGNSYINTSTLTVNGTSSSGNTTVDVYYLNGTLAGTNTTNESAWSLSFTLPDGAYNITANASEGLIWNTTSVSNVTVDATPPQVSITYPTSGSNLTRAIAITLNITEANINHTNCTISNSTGNILNSTTNTSNSTAHCYLMVYQDGIYNITATSYDKAGNQNSTTATSINVTGRLIPRLNTSHAYPMNNMTNQTAIGFYVYLYDNQTIDTDFTGNYSLNATNGTTTIPLEFTFSGGIFSSTLNTTNLSEGSYSLIGSFNDASNTTAAVNLSFDLMQEVGMNISATDESAIVKNQNFTFHVLLSKNGTYPLNGTICLGIPADIANYNSTCLALNQSAGANKTYNWTLRGTYKGTYTINVTFNTSDGKFNKTVQKTIVVRYGQLSVDFYSSQPPSQVEAGETFYVKVDALNSGDISATSVVMRLSYNDDYFDLLSSSADCGPREVAADGKETCSWTMRAGPNVVSAKTFTVSFYTADRATYSSNSKDVKIVAATSGQQSGSTGGEETEPETPQETETKSLSFLKPTTATLTILQGQNYTLPVSVKNTGTAELTNVRLEVAGLDPSFYTIATYAISSMVAGSSRDFNIIFSVPKNADAKNYDFMIRLITTQSTWSKDMKLSVTGKGLEVSGLGNISVTQGERRTIPFHLNSLNGYTLSHTKLSISGLPQDEYSLSPDTFSSMAPTPPLDANLTFDIPQEETVGIKTLVLTAACDEGNFSYSFLIKVLPSEEGKQEMEDNYEVLLTQFEDILEKRDKLNPGKVNVTEIAEDLNSTNETLLLINESLANGDYAEAQRLMDEARTTLNDLDSKMAGTKDGGGGVPSMFMAVAFGFGVVLVVLAAFYSFVPRKGRRSATSYTPPPRKPEEKPKKQGILSRLKWSKKDQETREKMVDEWRKRYELSKKKDPYGE